MTWPDATGIKHHTTSHHKGHSSDPGDTQQNLLRESCDRGETAPPLQSLSLPSPPCLRLRPCMTGQYSASGITSSKHPPNANNVTPRF